MSGILREAVKTVEIEREASVQLISRIATSIGQRLTIVKTRQSGPHVLVLPCFADPSSDRSRASRLETAHNRKRAEAVAILADCRLSVRRRRRRTFLRH